jgi:molybdate transport system permease protein
MGLSEWSVARVVTLPLAARGIGAGVALGFARALGDFGATVMVAGNIPGQTQTLPVAVYDAVQAGDDAAARTGSLVLGAIAILVLVLVTQVFGRRR